MNRAAAPPPAEGGLWDLAARAAVLIEAGAYITTPESHPLFPFDVAGYRGASVPFLAGNPLAHAVAAASCRALAPEWDREW